MNPVSLTASPDVVAKGIATTENFPGWVHQLDPFVVQFTEHLGVRWYGLAYLLGFVTGFLLMVFIARRTDTKTTGGLPEDKVADFILAIVLGTMIGGRLGYAIFYSQELLTKVSSEFPYWGVLRVWEGGMASHGGIAGIIIASIWFSQRNKIDWMHLGDLSTLGGSIGVCAGRIANFMNGELYGRPVASPIAWAVKFPSEGFLWLKHDAEQLISDPTPGLLLRLQAAAEAIGIPANQWLEWCSRVRTSIPARLHIQDAINKMITATEHGGTAVVQALEPVLTARHPYQIYGSVLEGALLFATAFLVWQKPRKPGVVGGIWITAYAALRILGEEFRMPDAHLGYQFLGLTRGQWISVAMLACGIAVLVYAIKRKTQPMGGWGKQAS